MDKENEELSCLMNIVSKRLQDIMSEKYYFPELSLETITKLAEKSIKIFENESSLIKVEGNFIIIGDLHGHFLDLIRILQKYGFPPESNYIFLGDVVDRGEFSLWTIVSILILKCAFPTSVYLIRGNHEFENVNSVSGFLNEVKSEYSGNTQVFHLINNVFNYLPIGIHLNNEILCVHGGIGPKVQNLGQIDSVIRPFHELYGGIADSILWSDPENDIDSFRPSKRGIGFDYGAKAIDSFLQDNNLRILIRGHQVAENGVVFSLNEKVVTVFSASNYCGQNNNICGVLLVEKGKQELVPVSFPSITPYLLRKARPPKIVMKSGSTNSAGFTRSGSQRAAPGSPIPSLGAGYVVPSLSHLTSPISMVVSSKRRKRTISNPSINIK